MATYSTISTATTTIGDWVSTYNLSISGVATAISGISMISGLTIVSTALRLSSTLAVSGAAAFSSTATFASNVTISANLTVVSTFAVCGAFTIGGSTIYSGSLNVAGNLIVSTNLTVTSVTTLSGNLSVASAIVGSSTLSLTSGITAGSLFIAGSGQVSGLMMFRSGFVSAALSVFSALTAGSAFILGNITGLDGLSIAGSLVVSQNATITGSAVVSGSIMVASMAIGPVASTIQRDLHIVRAASDPRIFIEARLSTVTPGVEFSFASDTTRRALIRAIASTTSGVGLQLWTMPTTGGAIASRINIMADGSTEFVGSVIVSQALTVASTLNVTGSSFLSGAVNITTVSADVLSIVVSAAAPEIKIVQASIMAASANVARILMQGMDSGGTNRTIGEIRVLTGLAVCAASITGQIQFLLISTGATSIRPILIVHASGLSITGVMEITSAARFSATVSIAATLTVGSALAMPYMSTGTSAVVSDSQTVSMGTSCSKWLFVTVSGTSYAIPLFSAL